MTQLLIVDNTNEAHSYQPVRIPLRVLTEGYAREPARWFTDCLTLVRTGAPDRAVFASRYREFVEGLPDDAEIYDVIAQQFPEERAAFPETYRAPGVNSLALLLGSRVFFGRFLRLTTHRAPVLRGYQRISRLILRALEDMSRYHAGAADISVPALRDELALLRTQERQALRLLRDDLAAHPVAFRLPEPGAGRRGGQRPRSGSAPTFNDLVPAPAGGRD